ncbi:MULTISPECIES: hypothetical protein [unclassified Bacillus (in: firmicutes)]|uniref:hypothetical protein n=1 Tax=unclassified Bacillus (in: firmicutes) TaxID=185979 RepID=UPI001BEB4843|nr:MULTISPECIES: hypothetical protein [unclassified Bacillus (in: firmicutes)]MBT2618883.1 hypothetical protein [Bacillus sp. ISL-78]MBT2627859.1 hypothetical protein [Bacillus sp. ISL-101]
MYFDVIHSPCDGIVEEVSITKNSRFYEWEQLFRIKAPDGSVKVIHIGVSGEVESLEVHEGEQVVAGMVLAYFKEDLFVTGSD